MPTARPTKGGWIAVALLLAVSCGDDGPSAPAGPELAAEAAPSSAAAGSGDPLLERARVGIREGVLPSELEAEVLGSTAPEHARARRVLLAMAEPPPGAGGEDDPVDGEGDDGQSPRPLPLVPSVRPPSDPDALPEVVEPPAKPGSSKPPRAPAPSRARAELGTLSLRSTKRGAVLVIPASSSLVVGVANQPASGIVRLMIESAQAGSTVLGARPRTDGAAVTGVRQGQGTVQITVKLEPGWTLGSVQPFSGGAKVHLLAPP